MRSLAGERNLWVQYAKLVAITREAVAFAGNVHRLKGIPTEAVAYQCQQIDQYAIMAAGQIGILEFLIARLRREAGLNLAYFSRADRLT